MALSASIVIGLSPLNTSGYKIKFTDPKIFQNVFSFSPLSTI